MVKIVNFGMPIKGFPDQVKQLDEILAFSAMAGRDVNEAWDTAQKEVVKKFPNAYYNLNELARDFKRYFIVIRGRQAW